MEPFDTAPNPPPAPLPGAGWRAPYTPLPPPVEPSAPLVAPREPSAFESLRAEPDRHRRRWPVALLAFLGSGLAYVGAAAGVAGATADAAERAALLARHGDYGGAIALDNRIASLGGPLQFLNRSDVEQAPVKAQRSMLAWASALAAQGEVDAAVTLIRSVTDPALAADAARERATLLLRAATAAAQKPDYVSAVGRLEQLMSSDPTSSEAVQAAALLPDYQVGEAAALVATGRGADALALLDAVLSGTSAPAKKKAKAAYPAALLSAGREEVSAFSFVEARTTLQRLVSAYSRSAEAQRARGMLSAGQPVSGTLVDRTGHPIGGRVRLSSHFTALGDGYITSGPFYPSTADAKGDFTVEAVPVGGPYVLEVFHNGDWTTLVDPGSGQPADPVTVKPLEPAALAFIVLPA